MLDIGTGTGRMLELFAPRYERALGVDLSPAMLAVARANLERAGIAHARVRLGDIANLPVLRESFDLVTIHQVLHFLDDPGAAIAEAAGALAPGGRLLIIDFAPHSLEFLREQAHRRLGFARAQMNEWIAAAGLALEAADDLTPPAGSQGLTVTIWSARDGRAPGAAQAEAAR
jgi:ArsR family transcriptional regulator